MRQGPAPPLLPAAGGSGCSRLLLLLLLSGAVPSTGAASRGCLTAAGREPPAPDRAPLRQQPRTALSPLSTPHPAPRSDEPTSHPAHRCGRARGSAAPRPACAGKCRRGAVGLYHRGGGGTWTGGDRRGRSLSSGRQSLTPPAASMTAGRRLPRPGGGGTRPPGRAGAGSRRPPCVSGWLLPGTAGAPEPVPGEDGVSRAAGARRVLPGRGERGLEPAGGCGRRPGGSGGSRVRRGLPGLRPPLPPRGAAGAARGCARGRREGGGRSPAAAAAGRKSVLRCH